MLEIQAHQQVLRLTALFPTMTTEQGCELARQFKAFDVQIVTAAIEEHHLTHKFVNGYDLLTAIRKAVEAPPEVRTAQAKAAVESRLARIREENRSATASVDACFAKVSRLTPEELAEHRAALLATCANGSPVLVKLIRDGDPTKSPTLAALIAQRMETVTA